MNFLQAKEELGRIAEDQYHALSYEVNVHVNTNGFMTQECKVYINEHGFSVGKTWKEALDDMTYKVLGIEPEVLVVEDVPELE